MSTLTLPLEPFTAAALPDLGLTPRELRRALEQRRVRRLVRGVYVDAGVTDSIQLRAAALLLVVNDTQVIVDRTAAWLHGIDAYSSAELEAGPPVETCALRGHTRTRLDGVRGRTRDLAPDDVMVACGLRVTTPLRTALDLGCHLRRREAFAVPVRLCAGARNHHVGPRRHNRPLPPPTRRSPAARAACGH